MSAKLKKTTHSNKSKASDLTKIRKKIDAFDKDIYKNIMGRAALVSDLLAAKKKDGLPFIMPAREAQLLRKILGLKNSGKKTSNKISKTQLPQGDSFPDFALARIWREIIGALSVMQTDINVSVCIPNDDTPKAIKMWDIARGYFGSQVSLKHTTSSLVALSDVREGDAMFAILPSTQDQNINSDNKPWWVHMSDQEQGASIVLSLPFGRDEDAHFSALVVSNLVFEESGEDNSFFSLEVSRTISRARLLEILNAQDGVGEILSIAMHERVSNGNTVYLIEMQGGLSSGDVRLTRIEEALKAVFDAVQASSKPIHEIDTVTCRALGGYPVSPVLRY